MTVESARSHFPALSSGFAYLENAGGSQVPLQIADAVRDHMLNDYVQLGAGYPQSKRATQTVAEAHAFAAELFNSGSAGAPFLGASTTSLIHMVAKASGEVWRPGDEIIIAETNHEANAGAWDHLRHRGLTVKTWPMNRDTYVCPLDELERLLSPKTKLVAMPHVSNLVGKLEDVRGACEMAHHVGAQVFADGVAYAPHHSVDVQSLGVDWYVCSAYKVYGPHMAILFGRFEALEPLTGPNHSFVGKTAYPDKWEPGGVSHEACAGLVALKTYLAALAETAYQGPRTIETAFQRMASFEKPVEALLRDWLASRSDLTLIGPKQACEDSVATISFVHHRIASDAISRAADENGFGIRHGNMYAVRLLDALQISRYPGVVRVSAVHYNTVDEIERLIELFDRTFAV
jgi:cysteine desulfurase family protein (TIGR01976 family)